LPKWRPPLVVLSSAVNRPPKKIEKVPVVLKKNIVSRKCWLKKKSVLTYNRFEASRTLMKMEHKIFLKKVPE
jgi:hypothetical protein